MKNLNETNPIWGIMQAQGNAEENKKVIDSTAISMVRVPVYYFDLKVTSNVVDDYVKHGYNVEINFNWKPTSQPVETPTNDTIIRSKAREFFDYYAKYRSQIPVVVVGNEWDNLVSLHGPDAYHSGTIKQYLNELSIITEIAHEYGFLIASAGITGNNLQRWTYSKLTGTQQKWWKANYFVGLKAKSPYDLMVKTVDEFCAGVREIPTDFANTHWYNPDNCNNGYPIAAELYKKACGKDRLINNEFGIKKNSLSLFTETIAEIKASGAEIAIIYSGVNTKGDAVRITPEMLATLI